MHVLVHIWLCSYCAHMQSPKSGSCCTWIGDCVAAPGLFRSETARRAVHRCFHMRHTVTKRNTVVGTACTVSVTVLVLSTVMLPRHTTYMPRTSRSRAQPQEIGKREIAVPVKTAPARRAGRRSPAPGWAWPTRRRTRTRSSSVGGKIGKISRL